MQVSLLGFDAVAIFFVCCCGCGPCGQRACVVHMSTALSAAAPIVFEEAMELATGRVERTLLLLGRAVGDQRSTFVIRAASTTCAIGWPGSRSRASTIQLLGHCSRSGQYVASASPDAS